MNYLILIIVAVMGIAFGAYFAPRNPVAISEQSRKKQENKDKVLAFARKNGKVKNGDVEKMLGVSDATAERYLNELEKEGKLTQHGKIGTSVFYTSKYRPLRQRPQGNAGTRSARAIAGQRPRDIDLY
jgi:hypothetical protein